MFSKRSDLGRENHEQTAAPTPAPSAPKKPAGTLSRSVILPDLVIQGAVVARGEIELHGLVEGDVVARSIVVGPSATVLGDILGERVSISGAVRGCVSGHQVHLGPDARYQGDIRRGLIAIDDGAHFEGSVRSLTEQDKREIAQRLEIATPSQTQQNAAAPAAPGAAPGSTPLPRGEAASSRPQPAPPLMAPRRPSAPNR